MPSSEPTPSIAIDYTWEECASYAQIIAEQSWRDQFIPEVVISIYRGGTIPAAMVQRAINAEGYFRTMSIYASSYDANNKQGELTVIIPREVRETVAYASRVLIVDDIYDTGATLKAVRDQLSPGLAWSQIKTAVLVTKDPKGTDYFGHQANPKVWVNFPWEGKDND